MTDDRITLYIDVDGVLLALYGFAGQEWFQLRPNAVLFLMKCVEKFDCVWLTAWGPDDLKALFGKHYGASQWLNKIRYAKWGSEKLDAIDVTRPFLWIEDGISEHATAELTRLGLIDCYHFVDEHGAHGLEDVWTWLVEQEARLRHVAS